MKCVIARADPLRPGIVHDFSTLFVMSARNAWSGVPDTSAKARIIPAAPSTAALGAFFDSVGWTFLFWQTPHLFDFAKSCKHLFVLFINSCSFRQVDRLDEVSMGAGHYNKGIHATELPASYVLIRYIGGVVHDVWVVNSDDTVCRFLPG